MNENQDQQKEITDLPAEVQEFILSSDFSDATKEMCLIFETPEESETLETIIRLFLIDENSYTDMLKSFIEKVSAGNVEKKAKALAVFTEKIVAPIALLVEIHQEIEKEKNIFIEEYNSDTENLSFISEVPAQSILAAKFGAPLVAAPITTVGKKFVPGNQQQPTQSSQAAKVSDPYRELPL